MVALHTTENIASEAVEAARAGARVAVFAETLKAAQSFAAHAFEEVRPEDLADVRRANGDQQIRFPAGGAVHFQSLRNGGRGLSLDRAYVPAAIEHPDAVAVAVCLQASADPRMIGYFPRG